MLKPLKNKIILSVEKSDKTESGTMLTSNVSSDSIIAKVVEVSDSCFDVVDVDSTVIISKFAGNKLEYNGKEYMVVDINDILAIVEEE